MLLYLNLTEMPSLIYLTQDVTTNQMLPLVNAGRIWKTS